MKSNYPNRFFNLKFDALIERLTGREMLTMYAHLRGVPSNKVKDLVSSTIKHLNLTNWADKLCGDYRSVLLLDTSPFTSSHLLSVHFLHTVLFTFPLVLTRRIWLLIKSFFSW